MIDVRSIMTWHALAHRRTRQRRRAEHMGFKFDYITVFEQQQGPPFVIMMAYFRCVCGRAEGLHMSLNPTELMNMPEHLIWQTFDPALELRKLGSFSREHLLADGYGQADVDRIIGLGHDFDRANAPGPGDRVFADDWRRGIQTSPPFHARGPIDEWLAAIDSGA